MDKNLDQKKKGCRYYYTLNIIKDRKECHLENDWFWRDMYSDRSVRRGYLQMASLGHLMTWVVESVLLNDQFRLCRMNICQNKF